MLTLILEEWTAISQALEDIKVLQELAEESPEEQSSEELTKELLHVGESIHSLETKILLGGEEDENNAYLNINAGSGGTESQDWGQMLLRMYQRWCEKKNFPSSIVELSAGEETGIKSVTILIKGTYAYGFLRSETGVHRLVRISPFDSNKRRHTSFASVYVYPEVDEDVQIEIKDADLRIDVYRASGAGGQHVNTTDSAVRIFHKPTKITVTCQNERSQHKNKATAMKMLKAQLYKKHLEEQKAKQAQIEATKMANEWGSQIRSYVLHPYQMVKDHRTQKESSETKNILDGDLDAFMQSFLLFDAGMEEKKDQVH